LVKPAGGGPGNILEFVAAFRDRGTGVGHVPADRKMTLVRNERHAVDVKRVGVYYDGRDELCVAEVKLTTELDRGAQRVPVTMVRCPVVTVPTRRK